MDKGVLMSVEGIQKSKLKAVTIEISSGDEAGLFVLKGALMLT